MLCAMAQPRSFRNALAAMPNDAFGDGDPRGEDALRQALSEYLGRVRGLVTDAAIGSSSSVAMRRVGP